MDTTISSAVERDDLTGLINRFQCEKELELLYKNISFNKQEHAFCYIDLDMFKVVNDVYGHAAGDKLICSISSIIKSNIRQQDILSRLGGDEFGLIIKHCDIENAVRITSLVKEAINKFRNEVGSKVFSVSASIGIVIINSNTNDICDLLKHADIACNAAKNAGRNRIKVYSDDDKHITSENDDMMWFNHINNALDNNQFCLYAQVIMPLAASELLTNLPGYEVLLRMKDDEGNLISPALFFPPAARYGLASRLDRWVIDNLLNHLESNISPNNIPSIITINLSGQSLGDEELLTFLDSRLDQTSFPTENLCFEITETEAIKNINMAIHFIHLIKNKFGCKFALDDFGTGFSSFTYIRELPIDIVKIDGSFVRDMMNDSVCKILIKALNDIAQVSNIKTIAEWVENEAILDEIQSIGINYGQGYYLGTPAPIKEL